MAHKEEANKRSQLRLAKMQDFIIIISIIIDQADSTLAEQFNQVYLRFGPHSWLLQPAGGSRRRNSVESLGYRILLRRS